MLLGLLEEIGDEPVVIFTSYKEEVNIISDVLQSSGGTYSKLTGDDHSEEDWRSGKTQYLIANISAGNAGIDLTRARYVIYWSLGYSATEYEQSIARVSRPNQVQDTVFYYYLMYDNTLDKIIYETLKTKSDIKERLLNAL
jgi:superfamily II DNA or RNA helicase